MKKAFTLAEVLITLTIIGVIAALTIPNLMQKHQEQEMITRLKKVHSVLSNAYSQAIRENGSPDDWDIGTYDSPDGAVKFYNYLAPYLKMQKYCGNGLGCWASSYKALFNNTFWFDFDTNTNGAKVIFQDGSSARFATEGGCNSNASKTNAEPLNHFCASSFFDINGKKGPNKAGVDVFGFLFTMSGEVIPYGVQDFKANVTSCKYKDNSVGNGLACTAWALYKGNMDYLRRDISNEW